MILNTHPVPDFLQKRIASKGGLAPNGQSLFRIIWGGDRLTIIGGEWKSYDNSGNIVGTAVEEKLTTKYANAEDRWILEMWCPSENYGTPEQWDAQFTQIIEGKTIHTLGPYPHNGEYELVKVLETPKTRAFVPLTATICDAIIAVAVENRNLPHEIRMAAYRAGQKKAEDAKIQKRIDIIDNMGRAWEGKDHIIVPSNFTNKGRVILQ